MGATLSALDAALKDRYLDRPIDQLNNGGMMAVNKKMPPLGSGARFKALQGELAKRGAKNPGAMAAAIGRAKYGKVKMSKMAAAGRKRSDHDGDE